MNSRIRDKEDLQAVQQRATKFRKASLPLSHCISLTLILSHNGERRQPRCERCRLSGALYGCDETIRRNFFRFNDTDGNGGAIYNCTADIVQNFIGDNDVDGNGGALAQCTGKIESNFVFDNLADGLGGAVWDCDADFIAHNTIYSNTANGTNSAGGIEDSAPTDFYNNILWDNSDPQLDNSPGIEHSCIEATTDPNPNNGNIGDWQDSDPRVNDGNGGPKFLSTSYTGNNLESFLHLASDSPCIDRGKPVFNEVQNPDDPPDPVSYRDFDSQLGALGGLVAIDHDGDSGTPDKFIHARDIGADEFPTPDAVDFSFWWENF